MPDNWALEQLFPIIPIHKLNKKPTEYATLCDITCDSDGIVDKFVDLHDVKTVLELHKLVKKHMDDEARHAELVLVSDVIGVRVSVETTAGRWTVADGDMTPDIEQLMRWASLILTLPVVIVATEEGLTRIPKAIREGSLALGATKFETIWKVILPMSSPAMMTGLILAIARAAGEVAPLMHVAGGDEPQAPPAAHPSTTVNAPSGTTCS